MDKEKQISISVESLYNNPIWELPHFLEFDYIGEHFIGALVYTPSCVSTPDGFSFQQPNNILYFELIDRNDGCSTLLWVETLKMENVYVYNPSEQNTGLNKQILQYLKDVPLIRIRWMEAMFIRNMKTMFKLNQEEYRWLWI